MENRNGYMGVTFTFAVVVRGKLGDIDTLMDFLKASELTVAHQEIGQNKMWIKQEVDNDR